MHESTPAPTTDPKRRYICRHIHTKGNRCGSPALRGRDFCYYHDISRRDIALAGRTCIFAMPRVDDRAAIQLALFEVLSRLSAGDIEYKRASILLYGLQIASSNLPRNAAQIDPAVESPVEEITHDFHFGDLAPVAEIPEPAQEAPASALTHHAVIPPLNPVILSEGRSPQPKDPETLYATPTTRTILPPQPITLAAVQATAQQLTTCNLQLPTPTRYTRSNDSHPRMAPRRRQLPRPNQAPL